jgi:hypothetical protein
MKKQARLKLSGDVMDKFNLLSDQPLKSEDDFEDAKFGHKEISETLTSLIISCPTPFTIGLFGRWGAGKSTISYMLKNAMSENKFGFVLFDVWKHESDALRRTFLKESVIQLKEQKNVREDFKLEERLDSIIIRKVDGQLQLKELFKKYWETTLLIVLCLILLGFLIYNFLGFENLKTYVSIVLSIFSGGGILTVIVSKVMSHFLTSETITHEIDRYKDPHEFEREFKKLLLNMKTDRLLVIFDNLDRVTHEKAVEILATTKTFLETENINGKGVVFLIPCDDRAIKEHLTNFYKHSDVETTVFNDEEFLRKFFNTTLRIPDFYATELESYAMDLLSQTHIPELKQSSVAWLVTKAYRQNPRQIKQFINQLISIYILAMKRIDKNSLPADFLAGNISKLAKFLILYNKFPKQMRELRQSKIWDIEQVTLEATIFENPTFAEFNKFLNETSQIPINNLNIFFTLRRSEFEVQLPGYDDFVTALQDNRIDDATAYLQNLPEFSSKKGVLNQAIKKLLQETTLPDTKISIINTCLTGLNNINEKLEDTLYADIFNELLQLKHFLYIIEPKVIFDQLLTPNPQYRIDFAKIYVNLLAQTEDKIKLPVKFTEALFSEIIKNEAWFKEHIKALSNIIANKYYDQPQIIQLFLVDDQTQLSFAIGQTLHKALSTLSPADLESGDPFEEKIKLLINAIPDILEKQLINITLVKLKEILTNENTKSFDPSRMEILKRFTRLLTILFKKHLSSFSTQSDQNEKDNFCQIIQQSVNRIGDLELRNIYIEPLLLLFATGITHPEQIINIVRQFISNTTLKGLLSAFEDRDDKEWNALLSDSNYSDHFKQKALKDQQIFDQLYKYLTEIQKNDWLIALLETKPIKGMDKIESLANDVPDTINILNHLLSISEKIDISNRFKVYEICDKLQFANNNDLLQHACEDVKKYVTAIDQRKQQFGFELLKNIKSFTDQHKRDIIRILIDWLISLQSSQIYQPIAIQTVLSFWTNLSGQSIIQRNFIEYIFRLLLSVTNIDAIKLGMEVLEKTKPNYTDFSAYYDDLKQKVETEQNITIRDSFILGFKKLKETAGEHTEWWTWINSAEGQEEGIKD